MDSFFWIMAATISLDLVRHCNQETEEINRNPDFNRLQTEPSVSKHIVKETAIAVSYLPKPHVVRQNPSSNL